MDIYRAVDWLIKYGLDGGLLKPEDQVYTINQLLELLDLSDYQGTLSADEKENSDECGQLDLDLEKVLSVITDYALEKGLLSSDSIGSRDLFDTRIMNTLLPRPSQVVSQFWQNYRNDVRLATDEYYRFNCLNNYIRSHRVAKDLKWRTMTEYGELDITINMSKPEKDPKDIAAALHSAPSHYPKCLLCRENEGYAGRADHPARQNLRLIPLTLKGQDWFLQYSPYVYYQEHCIIFNSRHIPMKIDAGAFAGLLDFVSVFPHYFAGSNADLPIVGGSILTHDHYQGGHYQFAMEKAGLTADIKFDDYPGIKAGIVKWPLSSIRLEGADKGQLTKLAEIILDSWRTYSDVTAGIYAETDNTPHNTITPIARRKGELYQLDLVLRNNITTEDYPDGVFHPHKEYHHIKKENIGLIEVMGLAILPPRLKNEMDHMKKLILSRQNWQEDEIAGKHWAWYQSFENEYQFSQDNTEEILKKEIGRTYCRILEQCAVFRQDQSGLLQFQAFIETAGGRIYR